jgi:hypothetical protein
MRTIWRRSAWLLAGFSLLCGWAPPGWTQDYRRQKVVSDIRSSFGALSQAKQDRNAYRNQEVRPARQRLDAASSDLRAGVRTLRAQGATPSQIRQFRKSFHRHTIKPLKADLHQKTGVLKQKEHIVRQKANAVTDALFRGAAYSRRTGKPILSPRGTRQGLPSAFRRFDQQR